MWRPGTRQVHAAPRQDEVTQIDEYIRWTLYGIKPDVAKPPFKSLQVGGDYASSCVLPSDITREYPPSLLI